MNLTISALSGAAMQLGLAQTALQKKRNLPGTPKPTQDKIDLQVPLLQQACDDLQAEINVLASWNDGEPSLTLPSAEMVASLQQVTGELSKLIAKDQSVAALLDAVDDILKVVNKVTNQN